MGISGIKYDLYDEIYSICIQGSISLGVNSFKFKF